MKNILLLYKKLWAENKAIIILYLLLLVIAAAALFRYDFYMAGANISRTTNQEIPWIYNQFQESTWAMVFVIVSFSFVISLHWGIRHFNYSPQSYHYNTLPLSLRQKLGFILSYVFLLLPALHILILSAVFLPVSINAPASFNKTSWELYTDVLNHLTGDTEKWFPFSHLYFFMAIFLLVALFFNRMGFIKTVVAATVIMITGMVLYVNLNFRLWETRGDFGSKQSVLRFPDLYTLHYTCIALLFAAILYTVYQRLTDKNY